MPFSTQTSIVLTHICIQVGETVNNTIGTTWNPQNRTLSAGGACGGIFVYSWCGRMRMLTTSTGKGALIALKGSPLGIGTELGKTDSPVGGKATNLKI